MPCTSCGGTRRPRGPIPVAGPAVVLQTGAIVPFPTDEAAAAYAARLDARGEPGTLVLSGS